MAHIKAHASRTLSNKSEAEAIVRHDSGEESLGMTQGGVRGLDDLKLINDASDGRLDATVGSALDLFGGTGVAYKCLLNWNKGTSGA